MLPLSSNNAPVAGENGLYASAAWDQATKEVILKIVNTSDKAQTSEVVLDGAGKLDKKGKLTVLKSSDLEAVNSLDNPQLLIPTESAIPLKGKNVSLDLAPYSMSVVRVKVL